MNAQTSTGDTALTYACENGHTEVADLLLKYGAELEHESEGGRTPLMKAARAGHLSTVSFLLKRGAEVNRATANNDHTPLSLACAGGHQGVVEVLLQHGADPFHKLKASTRTYIIRHLAIPLHIQMNQHLKWNITLKHQNYKMLSALT